MIIPYLGVLISILVWLFFCILVITGIVNSLSGKTTPLPVIGQIGEKFNF